MLGMETRREPVTGIFARQIRDRMRRISLNKLNDDDCSEIRRDNETHKNNPIRWNWRSQL